MIGNSMNFSFHRSPSVRRRRRRASVDFADVHRELKLHRHLTLQLIWEEYRETQAGRIRLQPLLRAVPAVEPESRCRDVAGPHRPGEKMFVDWAGPTVPIYDHQNRRSNACVPVCRGARSQHLHVCAGDNWASIWPTGSTAMSGPLISSTARRN